MESNLPINLHVRAKRSFKHYSNQNTYLSICFGKVRLGLTRSNSSTIQSLFVKFPLQFPPSISVECNMARFHWASQVAMDTYIHRTTTGPPSVKNTIARDCTWLQTVSLFIADYPVLLVYFVTVIYKAHTWWQRKTCGTKINRFQRMLLKRHAVSRDYFFGENCPVHASDKVRWKWPRGAPGHLHNDVYSRTIFSPKKLLLSLPPEISIVNENTYELYISIKIVVLT